MIFKEEQFIKALPIWAVGKEKDLNCSLWFEADIINSGKTTLRIAGTNDYQVFVNGKFCHYGPARAGRAHYRVDEVDISSLLYKGQNKIRILASAYNIGTFCFFDEGGFLCAEIVRENKVLCATGDGLWKIYSYPEKIVRTQRYSYQRAFAEAYDFTKECECEELTPTVTAAKRFIKRELPYPALERASTEVIAAGKIEKKEKVTYYEDRALQKAGTEFIKGFKPEELEICTVWCLDEFESSKGEPVSAEESSLVSKNRYLRYKAESELTGFFELKITCAEDSEIFITFDEILDTDGKVNYERLGCSNVIRYKLGGKRKYHLISMQPYSAQYFDIICTSGDIEVESLSLIRLDFNPALITKGLYKDSPESIKKIYAAAVNTFRQNTVDIYMDCPSRERAGWLCDSFFTSRVEHLLTGASTVEAQFLKNFAMEDRYFRNIPDGMLPMCYPCGHLGGTFIPNWAMWYVLELREYLERSADREFIDEIRAKMYKLYDYFASFENSDGLLEKLESWVFVEWSRSNNLTQDINYPSNMLYYSFLKALGELYSDKALDEKAEKLRKVIREKSRCGLFFSDNSVYENGIPNLSGESTESCQYYAFFTGIATPEEDAELWSVLLEKFGPKRDRETVYPEVSPSNAFIGNYLRCEILRRYGLREKLSEDIIDYFLYMAERTGTLWENDTTTASCNHGFASHVLVWLDYLGYLE